MPLTLGYGGEPEPDPFVAPASTSNSFYETEGQTTGYGDGEWQNWVRYYDPVTGEIVEKDMSGMSLQDKLAWKNEMGIGYYYNEDGDFVYGVRPEVANYNPELDHQQENYEPEYVPDLPSNNLTLGGGGTVEAGGPTKGGTTEPPPPPPPTPPLDENYPIPDDGPPDPVLPGEGGTGPNGPWLPESNPTGTPPAGYQGGYEWNWADVQPGAPSLDGGGGYNPDDYAFDRYVPGQESPWGIPEVKGGNKDFYRNQFLNLLKDEQGFRDRQRAAALRSEEASQNPLEGINPDWSWIEGGLPEVKVYDSGYAAPNQQIGELFDPFVGGGINPEEAENPWVNPGIPGGPGNFVYNANY